MKVAFHGKLGDTLLALSAIRALTDWAGLQSTPPLVRATGPYADLVIRAGLATENQTALPDSQRVVIGDRPGIEAAATGAAATVVCDPAGPPCWSADGKAHPDLPARYYLALERRLGIRLPGTTPFAPTLATRSSSLVEQLQAAGWFTGLTIAGITATSWPERKDYTADRFTEVAERIAEARRFPAQLLLIGGQDGDGIRATAAEGPRRFVNVLRLDGVPAAHLVDLFPHCDLVVGNDTGLTHLAALARRPDGAGPPVVGLYARHSHSKWRSGRPNHHAVATDLSDRMHQGDLCPVRDVIIPDPADLHLETLTPATLARLCVDLLDGSGR
ncbi:glycosyltransferase family 9 protein [Streptomyces sp. CB02959]|uniref:glycosyltransferase family 9 protein n=1 Tax=Streptomyces sp. CB02959 TaxID=2020330 RepID=UPI002152FDFB|nr:glycosyltransferase family 9 protein [Streptomyces sp. CB02959]